ncbi:hypothetical protein ZIOFF_059502 [Zingiber officinale]|uniref:HAT C-terminal dimerisation domain-containing protein n=1 Tax=Zingiber officinale TaxID=94328 RepID=A0A8J5FAC7_ZINOF|nr:hypothetical protein ZIOFF_059502 [Zingiber officinale]
MLEPTRDINIAPTESNPLEEVRVYTKRKTRSTPIRKLELDSDPNDTALAYALRYSSALAYALRLSSSHAAARRSQQQPAAARRNPASPALAAQQKPDVACSTATRHRSQKPAVAWHCSQKPVATRNNPPSLPSFWQAPLRCFLIVIFILFAMESFQNESAQEDVDYSPLWKFVTKVEKAVGGGNVTWSCNICSKVCKGSYSRVKAHLLKQKGAGIAGYTAVTMDQMKRMQQLIDDAKLRKKNSKQKEFRCLRHLHHQIWLQNPHFVLVMSSTLKLQGCFTLGGLSFNIVRNPHYIRAFSLATQRTIPGYLPPGYNLLRTSLLQKEKGHIGKLLEPTKAAWKQKGVKYYSHKWLQESPNRLPPRRDIEVSRERKKCIERYYSNSSERRSVNEDFASFSTVIDDFSDNDSMRDRGLMSPINWWVIHGASTPTLQSLALKLLGHPSSSCCERNWSTYNFIHSLKRNKITPQRAEDLVYVHYNLRLLSRRSPHYNEGESKMWDIGADGFDSMDMKGAGILEIANLSLDEPELESVLFTDEGSVGDETDMDV